MNTRSPYTSAQLEEYVTMEAQSVHELLGITIKRFAQDGNIPPGAAYLYLALTLASVAEWMDTCMQTTDEAFIQPNTTLTDDERKEGLLGLFAGAAAWAQAICPPHALAHKHMHDMIRELEKLGAAKLIEIEVPKPACDNETIH